MIAVAVNPKSSGMDKLMAADKPTTDHNTGMAEIHHGSRTGSNIRTPKVNTVVGHGTPKVGPAGKA